jgi:hypothetical protein
MFAQVIQRLLLLQAGAEYVCPLPALQLLAGRAPRPFPSPPRKLDFTRKTFLYLHV